jgi:hypothetical protein
MFPAAKNPDRQNTFLLALFAGKFDDFESSLFARLRGAV